MYRKSKKSLDEGWKINFRDFVVERPRVYDSWARLRTMNEMRDKFQEKS